jgi:hypothetical protein
MADSGDPDTRYKTGRILTEYDLQDLHDCLPELWRGDDGKELSLRELARRINVNVVREVLVEAGENPLDGEAENTYRLLSDDDVSVGVRTQQRNRLERAGIDVDALEDDFVTHQAVYTYLTKGLGVSKNGGDDEDTLEKHETRIQRLRNRLDAVTAQSLGNLQNANDLTLGRVDTTVSVQVYCQDCETQCDLATLFDNGGCNCQEQL